MKNMALFTKAQEAQLLKNGADTREEKDYPPVVKLFTPDAQATWLLSEIDPEEPDRAFGLCDLGHGFPELGYVSLTELRALRGHIGLPVERDVRFEGTYPLTVYAEAARRHQGITENRSALMQAAGGRTPEDMMQAQETEAYSVER